MNTNNNEQKKKRKKKRNSALIAVFISQLELQQASGFRTVVVLKFIFKKMLFLFTFQSMGFQSFITVFHSHIVLCGDKSSRC